MTLYESGVRKIIDDYLLEESKKSRSYGDYWSASSAGYCMRKLIFERLEVPKVNTEDEARKQRVFTAGHLFHEWIQELTKKAGCSVEQETELLDNDIMVKGHFDDIIRMDFNENGEPVVFGEESRLTKHILYDYKTANSRSFNYKNDVSHYHKMQIGTYMYMLRKEKYPSLDEGRILILEKDTLRTKEFIVKWTPQLEKDVFNYWSTLNGYWKNKKMPKCTCADYEGGFLAKEKWNPYFYNDEPCSLQYYKEWKEKNNDN